MRLLVATLLVGAATLFEPPAWACGATPEPRYSVMQVWPQGDGTPPNAPLLVELEEAELTAEPAPQLVPSLTLVRLKDGESLEVDRRGSAPHLAWLPRAALEAGLDYEARYSSGYEGDAETSWKFSVGAEARPALSLNGELVVSLEPGKDPSYGDTLNDCGTSVMTGWVDVTKARIRLPRAQGGFDTRYAQLWLTDETPHSFRTPNKGDSEDEHLVSLSTSTRFDSEGRAEDVLFTLPEESAPYHPCVAVQASDARGDAAEATSVCLEQAFPLETPKPAAEPDDSTSSTSAACSIGSEGRRETGGVVLLALLSLAWRRRRGVT